MTIDSSGGHERKEDKATRDGGRMESEIRRKGVAQAVFGFKLL